MTHCITFHKRATVFLFMLAGDVQAICQLLTTQPYRQSRVSPKIMSPISLGQVDVASNRRQGTSASASANNKAFPFPGRERGGERERERERASP